MKTKETVSLCMIVKDEEDCILAAIQSVRNLTDELIVIDTGSTDNTPHLALTAGAKLFNFTWTKDFSMARNFALQQTSSDWIIVLDADEVLEEIDLEIFHALLTNIQVEGYYLRIRNILDSSVNESSDQVVRLFRNKPNYRFEGAIHEQVAPSILSSNNGGGLASVPLTIYHYGYLKDRLDFKKKFSRNSEIITQELEKDSDNPFLLYCLGLEYYQKDSIQEGLKHLTKALTRLSGNEGYFEDVLLNIALGYLSLKEAPQLINFLDRVLRMYPDHADFRYLRGLAYLQQSNFHQAVDDFERSLCIGKIQLASFYQLNCLLGDAYQSYGNFPEAQDAYTRALVNMPTSFYPLQQCINLINKGYSVDRLLKRFLLVENWPIPESWQGMISSKSSVNLEFCLIMLLLTLYRSINTDTFFHKELLNIIDHLLVLAKTKSRTTEPNLDLAKTQNIAQECLTLMLKQIQLCCMALKKDMEHPNFNPKNQVNNTLNKAFSILGLLID